LLTAFAVVASVASCRDRSYWVKDARTETETVAFKPGNVLERTLHVDGSAPASVTLSFYKIFPGDGLFKVTVDDSRPSCSFSRTVVGVAGSWRVEGSSEAFEPSSFWASAACHSGSSATLRLRIENAGGTEVAVDWFAAVRIQGEEGQEEPAGAFVTITVGP
jgi:hypothetical protein